MNRRTFIGSLCAVLTAPLWGKKAAEPVEKIGIDPKAVRRLLASRGLVVDRIEEIHHDWPLNYDNLVFSEPRTLADGRKVIDYAYFKD